MRLTLQGLAPILFTVLFVGLILLFGYTQLAAWEQPALTLGATAVALYLLWLLLESRVAAGEVKRERTRVDIGTCEAYATGRAVTTLAALGVPTLWQGYQPWMALGLALFVGGVAFRLVAIHTLGRFYSHRVRITGDHQIVDSGPYRWVRHPAYTGMLIAHLGFVLLFLNVWALAAWVLLLVTICVRIQVEERALFELPAYPEYALGRKRLLPGLW